MMYYQYLSHQASDSQQTLLVQRTPHKSNNGYHRLGGLIGSGTWPSEIICWIRTRTCCRVQIPPLHCFEFHLDLWLCVLLEPCCSPAFRVAFMPLSSAELRALSICPCTQVHKLTFSYVSQLRLPAQSRNFKEYRNEGSLGQLIYQVLAQSVKLLCMKHAVWPQHS